MIEVKAAGDAAVLVELTDAAVTPAAFAAGVSAVRLTGIVDVVPGARTVLVSFEPGRWLPSELAGELRALSPAGGEGGSASELAEIDVCYDGPDLTDVAELTGLSVAEVISRHAGGEYLVGWLGFAPGFGYLTGLDPALAAVPRLATPRVSVPAGSVAIAGGLAAIYPGTSPGGWRLLGRTNAVLWDPGRDRPALLAPGVRVSFRPVAELPARTTPAPPDPAFAGHATGPIEVLKPGPLTTIQDLGRPGRAHLGVPRSGAADPGSLQLANELAGNEPGDAALEVTLGRLALRAHVDTIAALAGAPVPVLVSAPGQPDRQPEPGRPFAIPAGASVSLGTASAGLRSYLALRGGIEVPPVLGSRSADLLSGLGPRPLRTGERLRTGPARSRNETEQVRSPRTAAIPSATDEVELRAIRGPRDDWFTAGALARLAAGRFTVGAASNRTGLRLAGPVLERARPGELPSEGMATGALQVANDGQPILLLADHPPTGGYPVIAVLRSADIGLAGQLRPGQRVRFALA